MAVDDLQALTIHELGAMIAAGELGRFLRLANLTGQPTLSLPCGTTGDGMPVGLQIIGHWLAEANLLALAGAYQEKTDWH